MCVPVCSLSITLDDDIWKSSTSTLPIDIGKDFVQTLVQHRTIQMTSFEPPAPNVLKPIEQNTKDHAKCTTCYDLNPELFSTRYSTLALNERCIDATISALKASTETRSCERCGVLYVGITDMHQEWQADHPDEPWFIGDSTQVEIYVRENHSVRVQLRNSGSENTGAVGAAMTLEFYTHTLAGMCT